MDDLELFGKDIKLDDDMQAVVAANGELVLTEGVDTGVQDIRNRLFTRLGTLFYDTEYGSLILDWINEEGTESNRAGFEAEIERRIKDDPGVKPETVSCSILSWDEKKLTASLAWEFIDEDHPYNLVIEAGGDKTALVIKDVNI